MSDNIFGNRGNVSYAFGELELQNSTLFRSNFVRSRALGEGGDGMVFAYRHKRSNVSIAVKTAHDGSRHCIIAEIEALKKIGSHENLAGMIGYCREFDANGPAIFLQLCDLGDLVDYSHKLRSQQREEAGVQERLPEVTVIKLMRDMALGLDWMHNGTGTCNVHCDLKPANILVVRPPGHHGARIPDVPIFKITDFARITPYPVSRGEPTPRWAGTYEYSPCAAEQAGVPKPAMDMWSLGCTVQSIALGIRATMSRGTFVRWAGGRFGKCPALDDHETWYNGPMRQHVPTVYRPLDLSADELESSPEWDTGKMPEGYRPFSAKLNGWYSPLFHPDPKKWVTASAMKNFVVPLIDAQIAITTSMDLSEQCAAKARALRAEAAGRAARKVVRVLSYEGSGYEEYL
jgi:serine/threonine protein kinase